MSEFACPSCGTNGFYQAILELRQLEIDCIESDGTVEYTDETCPLEYMTSEPMPDGFTPDTLMQKMDFFFCGSCNHTFTSEAFLPVTPEKLAAAMAGLADLTEED